MGAGVAGLPGLLGSPLRPYVPDEVRSGPPARLLIACCGVAFATWRLGGRTPQQWLPVLARYTASGVVRESSWREPWQRRHARTSALGPFNGLEVVEVETRHGQVGVVVDRSRRSLSAMVRLGGLAIRQLLDDVGRQRIVGAWSGVLDSIAQQPGELAD